MIDRRTDELSECPFVKAGQAQASLEAPVATEETANTEAAAIEATAAEAPVASAGDSLPVIQKEKETESLPAA